MRHALLIGALVALISVLEFHFGYDAGLKHQQSASVALDKMEERKCQMM